MSEQNIYILKVRDIQGVAKETINRILTDEEIIVILHAVEDKIHWYEIIESSILENIGYTFDERDYEPSHWKQLSDLKDFNLEKILKNRNPYILKSHNTQIAQNIVRKLIMTHFYSKDAIVLRDWLIELAITQNKKVYGGKKSQFPGIDLEFDKNGVKYIVVIKSNPNWGNATQISKMISDFNFARKTLRTNNSKLNVIAVNGCCYGRDSKPDKKGIYFKYCGQRFWEFISGDPELYKTLIEPLGHKAKERNEAFLEVYPKVLHKFILEFIREYCLEDGSINWPKIVELNSGIYPPKKARKTNPCKSV
ncbi:MAG: PmeII family type II restriction endonuclease [bacterium]